MATLFTGDVSRILPAIATMDLKIEIRKLYALHEATIRLDHAIRDVGQNEWTAFTPSRFIYAFFTFNAIYTFDWESSFKENKPIKWARPGVEHVPMEEEQFKAYLKYADNALTPNTAKLFSEQLAPELRRYGVERPVEELKAVDLVNATKKLKELARQLPGQFERLLHGNAEPVAFFGMACAVLKFVYQVRCNLFHGSKTTVRLLDPGQQRRLLVYTATLIAANSLLFRTTKEAKVGWCDVQVEFAQRPQ